MTRAAAFFLLSSVLVACGRSPREEDDDDPPKHERQLAEDTLTEIEGPDGAFADTTIELVARTNLTDCVGGDSAGVLEPLRPIEGALALRVAPQQTTTYVIECSASDGSVLRRTKDVIVEYSIPILESIETLIEVRNDVTGVLDCTVEYAPYYDDDTDGPPSFELDASDGFTGLRFFEDGRSTQTYTLTCDSAGGPVVSPRIVHWVKPTVELAGHFEATATINFEWREYGAAPCTLRVDGTDVSTDRVGTYAMTDRTGRADVLLSCTTGPASDPIYGIERLTTFWADVDGETDLIEPMDFIVGSLLAPPESDAYGCYSGECGVITQVITGDLRPAPSSTPDEVLVSNLFVHTELIGGAIALQANPDVDQIVLGSAVREMRRVGSIALVANPVLTHVSIDPLTEGIDADLRITDNPLLARIFTASESIGGDVEVRGNDSLELINGRSGVVAMLAVSGTVTLADNIALASIVDVALQSAAGLVVTGNTSLPCAAIEPLACAVDPAARVVENNAEPTCTFTCQ